MQRTKREKQRLRGRGREKQGASKGEDKRERREIMGKRQLGREIDRKDGGKGESGRTEKDPPRYRQTKGITGKDRLGQGSLESPQDRVCSLCCPEMHRD